MAIGEVGTTVTADTSVAPAPMAADWFGAHEPVVEHFVQQTARLMARALGAEFAGFAQPDARGKMRVTIYSAQRAESGSAAPAYQATTDGGMAAHARRVGNVVTSPDLPRDARFQDAAAETLGALSGMAIPLAYHEQPAGVLLVYCVAAREFLLGDAWMARQVVESLTRLLEAVEPTFAKGHASQLNAGDATALTAATAVTPRQPPPGAKGAEARVSARHSFPYRQKIAPLVGDQMPTWEQFVEVPCGDLSSGGISLWMEVPPSSAELVVALGRAPSMMHFAARVVRVEETLHEGRAMYQVGCQFTRRLYL